MKKSIALYISLLLVTGLLFGCAKTTTTQNKANTNETQASVSQKEDKQTSTRIYTDLTGREVEIPMAATRIVTINMTAEAIALGINPVGAADNWLTNIDASQKEGITSVGAVGNLSMETILQLEPDLILTPVNITDENTIESLSKVAPTVVVPFFGNALENLETVGDILGRSNEANEWISSYNIKAQETKEALSDIIVEGKTAMVVQLASTRTIYIYPSTTWPTIYDVLNLQLPDVTELKELSSGQELSLEKLAEYNPDYIFITTTPDNTDNQYKEELTNNPVWQSLNASKNNQVYTLGSRLSSGDVLTLEWALDEVIQAVENSTNESTN